MTTVRMKIKRGECPVCGTRGFTIAETQRIECLGCKAQFRLYTEGPGGRLLTVYYLKRRKTFVPTGRWDGAVSRPRGTRSHRSPNTVSAERISHT